MAGLLLEVGRITKPHGIKGEVIVELITNRTERVAPGTVLHARPASRDGASAEGREQDLVVERSSPHQGRWIVAFRGVVDRTGAESLRGTVLTAEAIPDVDALWVHELIGSVVIDAAGVPRGTVESVIANPASDLLELDSGDLVPLRFVTAHAAGVVTVDAPDGLFADSEG
ncbi:MAG: ribosome maturation factor RimM [Acidimicrobiales bacterium]